MKNTCLTYFLFLFLGLQLVPEMNCRAQGRHDPAVICDFTFPDTVCRNTPVTITNLSQGASTYFWKICSGTPLSFPVGTSTGQITSKLNVPMGITLVQEGSTYYSFITNSGDSTILRVTYQNSLLNPPTYDRLQIPGTLTKHIFGIQVKFDQGNWYGFVANGSSLLRLDFGNTLANLAPSTAIVATPSLMDLGQGLVIGYDGTNWVGFCTNFPANTITRFSWGSSLNSIPTADDLGNMGGLTRPMQPALISDATGWYLFVSNTTSLAQLFFGNSLLNTPTGLNLGNLTWITDNRGISVFSECGNPYALIANHDVVANQIFQVHFKGGLGGTKIITPLGSPGNLFETVALSESFDIRDTIFCIALNSTPSLTVLYFPPCVTSIIPVTTLFDPSPVVFPDPGSYTIKLTDDIGLPTEQQACKEIEVSGVSINLGSDTSLCDGKTMVLDPGMGFQSYLWNNGSNSQTLTVSTTGTFSVEVTNHIGCHDSDTIHVDFNSISSKTVDTTICFGETIFAGGQLRSTSGTYIDSLITINGCDSVLTTNLTVRPFFSLGIRGDTCITDTTTVRLVARVNGISTYTWQDGTHDSTIVVSTPGLYWVRVVVDNCQKSDSVHITTCPALTYFYLPNAFSPNGDGKNDLFRPVSNEIVGFHLVIYDRWGQLVFETSDFEKGWDGTFKGSYCEPGVYPYILTYGSSQSPGSTKKITGTVTLVR